MQFFDMQPTMGTGFDLQNYQPSPSQVAATAALMRAQQMPMDWSLLQNRWPLGWPERRPLAERFADFKTRLAEARSRYP